MRHHFKAPPVNEVVIGEAFVPRTDLLIPHIGAFWDRHLRTDFPRVEHGVPIGSADGSVHTDLATGFPLPRVLMSSADGASLVQMQADRLYVNWRKMEDSHDYPRFESVRDRYVAVRAKFNEFLKDLSGDELSPAGFELTYTNAFLSRNGWQGFGDLPSFFRPWSWAASYGPTPPKSLRLNLEMELPDELGKLILIINPATRKLTNEPAMRVDLTAQADARVAARTPLVEWSEIAHVAIVETFVKISTTEKLAEWGHWEELSP